MSQPNPDFASVQKIATQYSDSWFNEVIIESLTHGIYTALLSIVLWKILSTSTIHRAQVKILAGISVFMYIMATMHFAMRWFYTRRAFITNGETEETRLLALIDRATPGGPSWVMAITGIAVGINIFITDCVTIWRCWIIWERNWRVIVLPCICTLCGIVFGVFLIFQELDPLKDSQATSINWGMAYYIMALPTTVICTMLIVYRLAKAGATSKSLRCIRNRCYHVIEILVESSALYVVVLAIFIVFDAMNSPYNMYPQAVLDSVTGIAPALILLRVVSRISDRGLSDDDMHLRPLHRMSKSKTEGCVTHVDGDDEVMLIGPKYSFEMV
ncbi:uncharacterized protein ARMOST_16683 [Armillaria ostoyae]|uniref:Uncharacterized protein n=1 Tax=Armillaria ostoyae TaxID=47428 RepID=A0A284RWV9_ARMOS|nr:uncharacterized protein ARMOST_16683 [Armillaria ostoyae]